MNDVWVTAPEAVELTQFSRGTVYRYMRTSWITRQAWRTGKNGLNPREIALGSLPLSAQALYWMRRRSAPLCTLLDSDFPGMGYSDLSEERLRHYV